MVTKLEIQGNLKHYIYIQCQLSGLCHTVAYHTGSKETELWQMKEWALQIRDDWVLTGSLEGQSILWVEIRNKAGGDSNPLLHKKKLPCLGSEIIYAPVHAPVVFQVHSFIMTHTSKWLPLTQRTIRLCVWAHFYRTTMPLKCAFWWGNVLYGSCKMWAATLRHLAATTSSKQPWACARIEAFR